MLAVPINTKILAQLPAIRTHAMLSKSIEIQPSSHRIGTNDHENIARYPYPVIDSVDSFARTKWENGRKKRKQKQVMSEYCTLYCDAVQQQSADVRMRLPLVLHVYAF